MAVLLTRNLKRKLVLTSLATVFTLTSLAMPAYAQVSCERAHTDLRPYFSLEWRVDKKRVNPEDIPDQFSSGGSLSLKEEPLSPKSRVAVMELIRMIAHTRSAKFSYSDFIGKEFGRLAIGLPLANRYSIEITYKSDYSDPKQPRYVADQMKMIPPSGIPEVIRNRVQETEGGIDPTIHIDLTDYPAIADRQFDLRVPSEISGDALTAFKLLAPKLDSLEKHEMADLSLSNNYVKMRSLIMYRSAKAQLKRYFQRVPAKSIAKWLVGLPAGMFLAWQITSHFPNQVAQVKAMATGNQTEWVTKSLSQSLESDRLPRQVRAQVRELLVDMEKAKAAGTDASSAVLAREFPPDLSAQGKFQVSRDQFLWTDKVTDSVTGKQITLLYLTQDNRYGQIQYAVTSLDTAKYATLIKYIDSNGQFIPLRVDGVQQ